jgi:hypothetical protein
MTQDDVKPYVYIAVNRLTDQFYYGYRRANKCKAEFDLGIKYFSSSKIIKNNVDDYEWTVLKEFDDPIDAIKYEQELIFNNLGNPLLLNRSCTHNNKKIFYITEEGRQKLSKIHKGKTVVVSDETRKKLSISLKGITPWTKGKTKETDERIKSLGRKISKINRGHLVSDETKGKIKEKAMNRHIIKCSCVCCNRTFDYGNFIKHISEVKREVSCICCKRVFDIGNFTKHIKDRL